MQENIIKARNLRGEVELAKIPCGIGYYKWYATIEDLNILLEKLDLSFDSIPVNQWDIENGLYCIYLGIAKKSLRERLGWHVNDKHTLNAVKSGALSTLRQSLSAVLFSDESNEKGTNAFIDKLTIHYYYFENLDPNSEESKKQIENEETKLINDYLHILNGAKNYNKFKSNKLRSLRIDGKKTGIKKLEKKNG